LCAESGFPGETGGVVSRRDLTPLVGGAVLLLRASLAAVLSLPITAGFARSQEPQRSLDLTIGGTGISIGDSRRARGLRLNFRDGQVGAVVTDRRGEDR